MWQTYRIFPLEELVQWRITPSQTLRPVQKAHHEKCAILVEQCLRFVSGLARKSLILCVLHYS